MSGNLYDALTVRLDPFPTRAVVPDARSGRSLRGVLSNTIRLYALAASIKLGLHRRLVSANLKLDWFDEFQAYWTQALGGRHLLPIDFTFLYGVYRQRLQQERELGQPTSDPEHFRVWQDPRLMHLLFRGHYRYALNPIRVYRYARLVARGASVCEYGCGVAPMTTGLARYYAHRDLRLTCADIPNVMFHFAQWKFRDLPWVRPLTLKPHDDAPLDERYDVIFCFQTLEHLPRPLAILRHLHSVLKPGGHFVFDYIASLGEGLDTPSARAERPAALEFVNTHYRVLEGSPDEGSGVVVCRKDG